MRPIDADALVSTIRPPAPDDDRCGISLGDARKILRNFVDRAPTIDAASLRPKGVWIVTECDSGETEGYPAFIEFHCPFCNEPYSLESGEYNWYYGDEAIPFNFCHNCGADMRDNPNDS